MKTLTLSLLMLLPFATAANTVKDPHPKELACLVTWSDMYLQRFFVFKHIQHEPLEYQMQKPDDPDDPRFYKSGRMICILASEKDKN